MKLKTLSIIGLFFFIINITFTQSVAWTYIADELTFGSNVSLTKAGDVLLSTVGEEHLVIKLSDQGELLWKKKICSCDGYGVVFSYELEDLSLLHITDRGYFYITNENGEDSQFLLGIFEENEFDNFYILDVQIVEEKFFIVGRGQVDGNDMIQRTVYHLDDNSLEHSIDSSGLYYLASHMKADGSRLEIVQDSVQTFLKSYDSESNKLYEKVISNGEAYFTGMSCMIDGSIVIIGSEAMGGDFPTKTNGVVLYLDSDGDELWKNSYESGDVNGYAPFKIFTTAEELEGQIQIGGSDGSMFFSDTHFLRLDKEGNTVWELNQHIKGEQDGVSSIIPLYGNSFLVAGTGGETDYSEPQRAYVMKLRGILDDVTESVSEDFIIFPNPSFSQLGIKTFEQWNAMEIINENGQRVMFSEEMETDFDIDLDLPHLKSGTYFIRLRSDQYTLTKRWIKI